MSSSENDPQNKPPIEQSKTPEPEPKPKAPEPQIIKTVHKNLDSFDSDRK